MNFKTVLTISLLILTSLVFTNCNSSKNNMDSSTEKTSSLGEPTRALGKAKKHDLSMYPKAKEGFTRYVIELPTGTFELGSKVELYAGKTMEVDCNQHNLSGDFVEKEVKGWGYNYFEFNSNGKVMSTMKACPDNKKTTKVVKSQGHLIRFNSKLPIVVYCPEGMDIRYDFWSKSNKDMMATPK